MAPRQVAPVRARHLIVELRPLLTIDVAVEPLVDLGDFPLGTRRVVTFRGGTFEGRDGLRGTIAPGGVDWQLARPDGVLEIDAHYLLLTDDGGTDRGALHRIAQGERRGGGADRGAPPTASTTSTR